MQKKTEQQIIEQVKSKWIEFAIVTRLPKTVRITVRSKDKEDNTNTLIGMIVWFPRWRCYAYEPYPATIYEKVCMRDIANLLELLTNNQRIK